MAKEVEIFVGPCSKFIPGQGWTTEIPVELLREKGYIKTARTETVQPESKETARFQEKIREKTQKKC